jgi:hypothetical protein
VSLVRYELGFYIAEDDILPSHRHEILRSYKNVVCAVWHEKNWLYRQRQCLVWVNAAFEANVAEIILIIILQSCAGGDFIV